MRGRGKGSFGQALLRSLKSMHMRQDLSFFGTITRFASQSGCFISLMNPASNSLASSSPMAYLLGSEKRRRACLTGLNPFCWKYALEAIIKALLLYFLVHDNCLYSCYNCVIRKS